MTTLVIGLVMFLEALYYLVLFDVILSWLTLVGIKFRPKFIADILRPIYKIVKKTIPTTFGGLDFTPIVIILLLFFLKGALFFLFPEAAAHINNFTNI